MGIMKELKLAFEGEGYGSKSRFNNLKKEGEVMRILLYNSNSLCKRSK